MRHRIFLACFLVCGITSEAVHAQLNTEQASIRKVFFDFLSFYKKNETAFNSFRLYRGPGESEGPPYRVQWKEVEKYFSYLRTRVPFVGEAYIAAERKHFQFSDSCFRAEPEEELPAGFDYDRWAGGQESIEYTLPYYTAKSNIYKVTIRGNKAELRIGSPLSGEQTSWAMVPFVKEKGRWKMADNVYPVDE